MDKYPSEQLHDLRQGINGRNYSDWSQGSQTKIKQFLEQLMSDESGTESIELTFDAVVGRSNRKIMTDEDMQFLVHGMYQIIRDCRPRLYRSDIKYLKMDSSFILFMMRSTSERIVQALFEKLGRLLNLKLIKVRGNWPSLRHRNVQYFSLEILTGLIRQSSQTLEVLTVDTPMRVLSHEQVDIWANALCYSSNVQVLVIHHLNVTRSSVGFEFEPLFRMLTTLPNIKKIVLSTDSRDFKRQGASLFTPDILSTFCSNALIETLHLEGMCMSDNHSTALQDALRGNSLSLLNLSKNLFDSETLYQQLAKQNTHLVTITDNIPAGIFLELHRNRTSPRNDVLLSIREWLLYLERMGASLTRQTWCRESNLVDIPLSALYETISEHPEIIRLFGYYM
mmetsp:Transcript_13977/g.18221  ORF Transcript_13977/g.18221 Transcript_13977/m.18221 type:complete len:395 (+) Transcript_13977:369-1553(+)|eukprot:CAMPEP_0198151768 /NCGR_PEP_ID=MMETSP1443-20131203/57009_1 /TAXON_ID=186043 /ORGANISM="Entomoneis sp., Strain CCMP2396" /LENGTH=394 /DNA_ID=CAMNT_0043817553 /DNA_START=329 /DNA_END=1513 /DNA_ORIENTATION=+